jgi:hypothetical protein
MRERPEYPANQRKITAHHSVHKFGELRGVIEQRQGREMIAPSVVVTPTLAGADQDPAVGAAGGLTNLDVDGFAMQNDFAGHSDSSDAASDVERIWREPKLFCERAQSNPRSAMEGFFLLAVIGAASIPVEHKTSAYEKSPPVKASSLIDDGNG